MKKTLLALALIVPLAGCAEFQKLENAYQVATTAKVSPQQIYIAANTFDGLQATATNYLVYCRTHLSVALCSADDRRLVIRYVRAGRAARNQLETYLAQNQSAPSQIYNTLMAAVSSLNNSSATKVSQ